MQKENRVVITGIGIIAPNGIGKDAFWEAIKQGRSGVKKISLFDASHHDTQIAGEVTNFDAALYIDKKQARRMARFSQFALAAAKMAQADALLVIDHDLSADMGVAIGVGLNGVELIEREDVKMLTKGPAHLDPFSAAAVSANSAAAHISVEFGLKGTCTTIATGCSAGLNAIGFAYETLRHGKAKIMFAGGAEAPISALTMASFCAARTLSVRNIDPEQASCPFDKNRDGFILGEGAGIFVIETLEHALSRNATMYAEIVGYASTSDAYSTYKVDPSGEAAARAMHRALKEAALKPADISYINAHGSSSQVSDIRETNAIKMVFDEWAYKVPVSSIKSMIGHPFAAAGSIQTAACLLAMHHEIIPPTINYKQPDPSCDLDYVPNEARQNRIRYSLVNSLGMGGNNVSLLLGSMHN